MAVPIIILLSLLSPLFVFSSSSPINGEKDFYQLLRVSRQFTERELRDNYRLLGTAAFQELTKEKEKAVAFANLTRAYYILSDSRTRQRYDQTLLKGEPFDLEEKIDALDVWNKFSSTNTTGSNVILLDSLNWPIGDDRPQTSVWMINFFSPFCGHCRTFEPLWQKIATRLRGIVKVGAIDVTREKSIIEKYVDATPTVIFFGYQAYDNPIKYFGKRKEDELMEFALDNIPNFVHTVTQHNFSDWMFASLPAVVFISDQPTSPTLKTLSRVFKKYFSFAHLEAAPTVGFRSFLDALNVESLPSLIILEKSMNGDEILHTHFPSDKKITHAAAHAFLKHYVQEMKKSQEEINQDKERRKINEEEHKGVIVLSTENIVQTLSSIQPVFSVIFFSIDYYRTMQEAAEHFSKKFPVNFLYAHGAIATELQVQFGAQEDDVVIFEVRRKTIQFDLYHPPLHLETSAMIRYLQFVYGGAVSLQKLVNEEDFGSPFLRR